eukprot:CAMPEP_0172197806 /NCGR_PEP_ID=MMETSP1050-20130122/27699_1 /TAXON_ID=233186 /ORGANISM="Cryptomonas curvata, Strain CCAP979/52" /LENGTH=141 /DNA_ID=CAMNT_0012874483 /DNA_START=313 /DNA_END=736 /DNA_ORIENTATION=-
MCWTGPTSPVALGLGGPPVVLLTRVEQRMGLVRVSNGWAESTAYACNGWAWYKDTPGRAEQPDRWYAARWVLAVVAMLIALLAERIALHAEHSKDPLACGADPGCALVGTCYVRMRLRSKEGPLCQARLGLALRTGGRADG